MHPYCIYVFDSNTANEAAMAVKEGTYETIVHYHFTKHSQSKQNMHQTMQQPGPQPQMQPQPYMQPHPQQMQPHPHMQPHPQQHDSPGYMMNGGPPSSYSNMPPSTYPPMPPSSYPTMQPSSYPSMPPPQLEQQHQHQQPCDLNSSPEKARTPKKQTRRKMPQMSAEHKKSGYAKFFQIERKKLPKDLELAQASPVIAERWSNLSPEEKNIYITQVNMKKREMLKISGMKQAQDLLLYDMK